MRRNTFALLFVGGLSLSATTAHAQRWQDADLTVMTGGPTVAGFSRMASVFDPKWNGVRTHYVATNWHIHELFLGTAGWQDADLTAITGGPVTLGDVVIAFDPVFQGIRTHYVSNDRHIHELYLGTSGWSDADLTAITGAALYKGSLAIAHDPAWRVMRTHYVATDGHVHELYLTSNGHWGHADLTAITGGPVANELRGLATLFDPLWNTMRTHYLATNGRVHELFLGGGGWQDADLTTLVGAPLDLGLFDSVFDPLANVTRSYFVGPPGSIGGHIFEFFLANGQWGKADLTAGTGGPAKGSPDMATAVDPFWNTVRVHYGAADWHVHELFLSGGVWRHADLTAITGGAVTRGGPLAMVFDPTWHGMRTHYLANDGHIHELFLNP